MQKKVKSILFVICAVMVFTAQTKRPDDKEQRHVAAAKPVPVVHNDQKRTQGQNRGVTQRVAPKQVFHRVFPVMQTHLFQASHQEREAPRVYAVPAAAPEKNGRLFHRQHHKNWQPRYNFYDSQYHFYPYVNIATTVELSTGNVTVGFNGQTYFYDKGTFYLQDEQGQYVAIAPPVGIIVNAIPDHARRINVDGQVYYRYKGVFYIQTEQGYQVVGPVQPVPDDS